MFAYDAEALTSFYAQYNAAVWPAQVVALALALAALGLTAAPRRGSGRLVGALLAAAWLWCGLVFFLHHFAPFDFMAPVYGWAFVAQALLLVRALLRGDLDLQFRAGLRGVVGLAVVVFALFGPALIAAIGDGGYASAPLVGLAPGPTALFTLALLLQARERPELHLFVLPLLWTLFAGVRAWSLGIPEMGALLFISEAAVVLALLHDRKSPRSTSP